MNRTRGVLIAVAILLGAGRVPALEVGGPDLRRLSHARPVAREIVERLGGDPELVAMARAADAAAAAGDLALLATRMRALEEALVARRGPADPVTLAAAGGRALVLEALGRAQEAHAVLTAAERRLDRKSEGFARAYALLERERAAVHLATRPVEQSGDRVDAAVAELVRAFGEEDVETGRGRVVRAASLLLRGDLQGALAEGARAFQVLDATLGPDHLEMAYYLPLRAVLAMARERFPDAETHLRRRLSILERARGPGDLELARGRLDFAAYLSRTGRAAAAAAEVRAGLAGLEAAVGTDDPRLAPALIQKVGIDLGLGEIGEMAADLARARRILSAAKNPNLEGMLRVLEATHEVMRGRVEEARELAQQAVEANQAIFGARNPAMVSTWLVMGMVFSAQGDASRARIFFERAADIAGEGYGVVSLPALEFRIILASAQIGVRDLARAGILLGETTDLLERKRFVPATLRGLLHQVRGELALARGRYRLAGRELQLAVGALAPEVGKDAPRLAELHVASTAVALAGGWIGEARGAYAEARRLAKGLPVAGSVRQALRAVEVEIFLLTGNLDKALAGVAAAIATRARTGGKDHPALADLRVQEARVHLRRGARKEAAATLREAARVVEVSQRSRYPVAGWVELLLALAEGDGPAGKAADRADAALERLARVHTRAHPEYAEALVWGSRVFRMAGNRIRARQDLVEAERTITELLGKDSARLAEIYLERAEVEKAEGKPELVKTYADLAVKHAAGFPPRNPTRVRAAALAK